MSVFSTENFSGTWKLFEFRGMGFQTNSCNDLETLLSKFAFEECGVICGKLAIVYIDEPTLEHEKLSML